MRGYAGGEVCEDTEVGTKRTDAPADTPRQAHAHRQKLALCHGI